MTMSQKTSSNGIDGSDSAVLAGEVHKRHDVVQEDLPDGGRGSSSSLLIIKPAREARWPEGPAR